MVRSSYRPHHNPRFSLFAFTLIVVYTGGADAGFCPASLQRNECWMMSQFSVERFGGSEGCRFR